MFLTLKNEKTLKKMRSKTLKNNIFFILGRNLIIRSFEIPHSIWKLHKDFKSVFVFKFRQKTKKFTPKWQKPLFEKRVYGYTLSSYIFYFPSINPPCASSKLFGSKRMVRERDTPPSSLQNLLLEGSNPQKWILGGK